MNTTSRSWANFVTLGYYFPPKKALEKQHKFFNIPSIDSLTSTLLKKRYSVYQSPQKLFKIIIILKKTFKETDRQKNCI